MPVDFSPPNPSRLSELTAGLDVDLINADGAEWVKGCAGIQDIAAGMLGYVSDPSYLENSALPEACFCITTSAILSEYQVLFEQAHVIVCANPRRVYATIAQQLYPQAIASGQVHPTAQIDETASIDPTAEIGAFCVIGKGVHVGAQTILGPSVYIGDFVSIGTGCLLASGVKVSHTSIGDQVQIAENTVIGKRGFGFEGIGKNATIIPHIGSVKIGNNVDIGALCTIDRGVNAQTIIEDYAMLDNLVHLAHNVFIGEGSILCAQCAIAGSSQIGKACLFGGKVGVADHVEIGDNAIIMGGANVTKSLSGGQAYAGTPAIPAKEHWKQQAQLRMLHKSKGKK